MADAFKAQSEPSAFSGFSETTSFFWPVADRLRGDYEQFDYGKAIPTFTSLRRLAPKVG
jgi:hypothetical protein